MLNSSPLLIRRNFLRTQYIIPFCSITVKQNRLRPKFENKKREQQLTNVSSCRCHVGLSTLWSDDISGNQERCTNYIRKFTSQTCFCQSHVQQSHLREERRLDCREIKRRKSSLNCEFNNIIYSQSGRGCTCYPLILLGLGLSNALCVCTRTMYLNIKK